MEKRCGLVHSRSKVRYILQCIWHYWWLMKHENTSRHFKDGLSHIWKQKNRVPWRVLRLFYEGNEGKRIIKRKENWTLQGSARKWRAVFIFSTAPRISNQETRWHRKGSCANCVIQTVATTSRRSGRQGGAQKANQSFQVTWFWALTKAMHIRLLWRSMKETTKHK